MYHPTNQRMFQRRVLPPGFRGPGFTAEVGGKGLDKVLQAMLPKVIAKVNGMTLPALSGVAKGITYTTDPIHISNFNIGSSTISIVKGTGILLSLHNLTLSIPSTHFKLSKTIIITLSCSGAMQGNLSNTNVQVLLNITSNHTSPRIMSNSSWSWGVLDVNEKMNGFSCKFLQNIAEWFVGNINDFISKEMKLMVPSTVDGMITEDGNQILSELVLTQRIDDVSSVNFYLVDNPTSTDTSTTVELSGEFVSAGVHTLVSKA